MDILRKYSKDILSFFAFQNGGKPRGEGFDAISQSWFEKVLKL
jgi:hypothetical protein